MTGKLWSPRRNGFRVTLCVAVAWLGIVTVCHARPFFIVRRAADIWLIVDPAARESVVGDRVQKLWVVTVQRNIAIGEPAVAGYVRSLNEYDCENDRFRWHRFKAFYRDGSLVLSRENLSPDWEVAAANSVRLVELRIACGRSAGDSVVEADSIAKLVIAVMRSWDSPTGLSSTPAFE